MPPDQPREYPCELPVLALRDTVVFPLTLQPLAITRPMSIESVNRALAGDRLLFLTLQTTERRGAAARPPEDDRHDRRDPADGEGAERRHPRHRRRPDARACGRDDAQRPGAARDGGAGAGADRALARGRRVRAPPPRADRSRAVGDERAVAGTARPGGRHRRSAAARLPALEPARHEGRGEAADPRARRAHREAAGGRDRARTARSRCSSSRARSSRPRSRR